MTGTWNCHSTTFTASQDGCSSGGTRTPDIKFTVNNYDVTFTGQKYTGLTAIVNKLVTELRFPTFVCEKEPGK